jgi:hypothetical protein
VLDLKIAVVGFESDRRLPIRGTTGAPNLQEHVAGVRHATMPFGAPVCTENWIHAIAWAAVEYWLEMAAAEEAATDRQ